MSSLDSANVEPRITFAVIAFNQARYIDGAIDAALSQTWGNLEIILSDDCSSDATFRIMQDRCARYTGPHTVRLNRNRVQQGIAGHVNTIIRISEGKLIILAAGDDVSVPSRSSRIVEEWRRTGFRAASFHSAFDDMSEEGMIIERGTSQKYSQPTPYDLLFNNVVTGATEAWSRDIFDMFGPLNTCVTHEDRNIAVRASLLGGVYYIPERLVARRRGGISASSSMPKLVGRRRNARRYICDMSQSLNDFHTALSRGLIDGPSYAALAARVSDRLAFEALIMERGSIFQFVSACVLEVYRAFRRSCFALYKILRLSVFS